MEPQVNKILSRLGKEENKTELAAKKVELNVSSDSVAIAKNIDKEISSFGKEVSKAEKFFVELKKMQEQESKIVSALDKKEDNASKLYNSAIKQMALFEKMAKDLGINANESQAYKDLRNAKDEIEPFLNWRFVAQVG